MISLLSLVGRPPTAVFVGKLTTFMAGWDRGLAWLVVLAALNTVASLFYYLRWIAPALARSPGSGESGDASQETTATRGWTSGAAVVAGALVLALGLLSGLLWP